MKFSNRALRDPIARAMVVLGLVVRGFANVLVLRGIAVGCFLVLVFDSSFAAWRRFSHIASDTATGFLRAVGGILALNAAFDDQGVGISELDVHIFLVEAGKFALELVGLFVLADVEFGLEGADGGVEAACALSVVVVEETEEGVHVAAWEACEERHCCLLICGSW